MGDFLKGSELEKYPKTIQEGVALHRKIDKFTDNHKLTKQAKALIRADFERYTPVVCDVFFDYFLGVHWRKYSEIELGTFSKNIYSVLNQNISLLPERSKRFLYHMETNDILVQYGTIQGIGKVLFGLSHRAKFQSKMLGGEKVLEEKKEQLEKLFLPFFDDLIIACKQP